MNDSDIAVACFIIGGVLLALAPLIGMVIAFSATGVIPR